MNPAFLSRFFALWLLAVVLSIFIFGEDATLFASILQGASVSPPATPSAQPGETTPERAEQILRHAVQALGDESYLQIRSVVGKGLYTAFQDGRANMPSTFVDYLVYPDKERTEFRSEGIKIIQTNVGSGGWVYDGAARTLRDLKSAQVEDFKLAMRTSIENLLRGSWRGEGAKINYAGRREAGLARRNEVVRLSYEDGFWVEFEFNSKDGLPAKTVYKRRNADGEETLEEDRFAQHVMIGGVLVPFIIDHYRDGKQTSRINYETVEFNRSLPATLFERPTDIKALK